MICPLLTYGELDAALQHLEDVFGLTVVRIDGGAEIRWGKGVAVAQTDRPADLHGTHIGQGWVYVQVDDPDAHHERVLARGGRVLGGPHDGPGGQRGFSALDVEGNLWTFARLRFGAEFEAEAQGDET
jgi:predicted enzyme related to lactoylglutathione lyase